MEGFFFRYMENSCCNYLRWYWSLKCAHCTMSSFFHCVCFHVHLYAHWPSASISLLESAFKIFNVYLKTKSLTKCLDPSCLFMTPSNLNIKPKFIWLHMICSGVLNPFSFPSALAMIFSLIYSVVLLFSRSQSPKFTLVFAFRVNQPGFIAPFGLSFLLTPPSTWLHSHLLRCVCGCVLHCRSCIHLHLHWREARFLQECGWDVTQVRLWAGFRCI